MSHPVAGDPSLSQHTGPHLMATGDSSVPANVVLHPLTSLALQPPVVPGNVSITGMPEQDASGEQRVHTQVVHWDVRVNQKYSNPPVLGVALVLNTR